ncbi:MAG: ATP-binding protein [Gemmataceae bacterium]
MQRLIDWSDSSDAQRLERLLAGYRQFLAHDLANQLVAIQAFARLLLDQLPDAAPEARVLLTRLADLARGGDPPARRAAEFGRLIREAAVGPPFTMADVAAEAVAEVKASPRSPETTASGVAFVVVQNIPTAAVSPRLLHRVLVELLHNAVAARATRIEISMSREGGPWLTVRDDGTGLNEPVLARLGTPGAAGPGLGWFFVAQAVASWRGCISVQSGPGKGTTISLRMPGNEA